MKKIYFGVVMLFFGMTALAQDQGMQPSSITTADYVREIPALSSMDNIIAAEGFACGS